MWVGTHPWGQRLEDTTDITSVQGSVPHFSCTMFTTPALAPCGPRAVPGLKGKALSDALQSSLPFYFGDGHRRRLPPAALDQAPGPFPASQLRPRGQMCGSPGTPLRKGQTSEWTKILRTLSEAGERDGSAKLQSGNLRLLFLSLSIPLASLSSPTLTNSDLPAFALQGTWAGGEQSSVLGLGIFSLLSLGARVAGGGGGRGRETSETGKGKNRGREIEFPQGILFPKCNLEELQKSLFLFLFFSQEK